MKELEVKNITKKFPGVLALDDVNINFASGKVHCILGENGAGKSTLVKIISNVLEPETGELFLEDQDMLKNKKLFKKVAYVPQELSLFNHMTVAENILLPFKEIDYDDFIIKRKKINKMVLSLLDTLEIDIDPGLSVNEVSVTARQLIQVGRALSRENYDIIIFDEPTTSLDQKGKESLFRIINRLKEEGIIIIYISHKIEELFKIGDEVTVLREGKKVGHSKIIDIDKNWMVKKMSGKRIDDRINYRPQKPSDNVIFEVENLTGTGFNNIDFEVYAGEILGFAGIVGSGRTEIMQSVYGYLPIYTGEARMNGKEWKFGDTSFSVKNGLFYLPEERKEQGIFPNLSVRENIGIALMDFVTSAGVISGKKEKSLVKKIIRKYDIKTPSLNKKVATLSGGNQQKAIVGRATSLEPKVIIFDEPTKGIDIATKEEIYRLMKKFAEERNVGIIFISSELDELMRCTNRIITINEGKKTGVFRTEDTEKSTIMKNITQVQRERG